MCRQRKVDGHRLRQVQEGGSQKKEWKHRLWARVHHTQTHTQAVWLSIRLSGWLVVWDTHTQSTPQHQSSSTPTSRLFLFFLLLLAPLRSLCLRIQTNQSSFDLLEMSSASEKHFECDEWAGGGGFRRMHRKSGMGESVAPFQLKCYRTAVLITSRFGWEKKLSDRVLSLQLLKHSTSF